MTKDFFELVYEVARHIPKGRVTSYGAIGKYLGSGRSARMVGWAMNAAPHSPPDSHRDSPPRFAKALRVSKKGRELKPVPAHRVVNRNGELTGKHHFGHPKLMQKLLEKEGVKVKNNKVVNFKKLFWDPAVELEL